MGKAKSLLLKWSPVKGSTPHKNVYGASSRGQIYKTIYSCNLQVLLKCYSVCPWQAFPVASNICGLGQEPTLE